MRCDLIGVSEAADNGARVMHELGLRSATLLVRIYQDLDMTTGISLLPDGVIVLFFFYFSLRHELSACCASRTAHSYKLFLRQCRLS